MSAARFDNADTVGVTAGRGPRGVCHPRRVWPAVLALVGLVTACLAVLPASAASAQRGARPRVAAPSALPDPEQEVLAQFGLGAPTGIAVDGSGNVFVSDAGGSTPQQQSLQPQVVKFSSSGAQTTVSSALNDPTGVAVDAAGNAFVNDFDLTSFDIGPRKFPADGSAPVVLNDGLSMFIEGIAVGPAGSVYVTGHQGFDYSPVVERVAADGTETTIPFTGLDLVGGIAVDTAGTLYVTDEDRDTGAVRVVKRQSNGTQTTLGFTGLAHPAGVAVDGDGTVYVADNTNSRVVKLPVGGAQSTLGFTGLVDLAGVAVGPAGTVYVVDRGTPSGSGRVVKLASGGPQARHDLGEGLVNARDVAVDGAGNAYVVDAGNDRIVRVSGGGAQTTLGFTGLSAPDGIAVDGSGTLFVADAGNDRIVKLPNGGAQATVPTTGLSDPGDVAVDAQGNLYVADSGNDRIVKVPVAGPQVVLAFTGLSGPTAVEVDADGNVYVADAGNYRVVELPAAGAQIELPFRGNMGSGLAVDAAGDVFATSYFGGSDGAVMVIPKGGTAVALPFPPDMTASGVATDSTGKYVRASNSKGPGSLVKLWVPYLLPSRPTVASLAAGNQQVLVTWSPAPTDGGTPITSYVLNAWKDAGEGDILAGTVTVPVSSLTLVGGYYSAAIPGLANGTAVRVEVAAVNGVGTGEAGQSAGTVTPTASALGPPTIGVATGGNGKAKLTWTAPTSTGGSAVTGYVVTPYVGGVAQPVKPFDSTATSQTVTGLTNGTAYTFKVAAKNAGGVGPQSGTSLAVPPFASPSSFTQRQYQDFLGRAATSAEVAKETTALGGGATPAALVASLRRSNDATANVDPTTRLYFAYFLRIPDRSGLTYWVGRKRAGTTPTTISNTFATSAEFKRKYGSLSNQAFVNLVYQNVLGRAGDAAGVAYWTGQLNSGKKTRGQVMLGYSESSEYKKKKAPALDVVITWLGMLGASPSQASFDTWVTNLTTGGKTVKDLAVALLADPAYATRVG